MADIEDIRDAVAAMVAAATHPAGVSITGGTIAVYPGYPNGTELDAAMARGDVHAYVNSIPNMTTTLPCPLAGWQDGAVTAQTLIAAATGQTIAFSGTVQAGTVVQVGVNRISYHYVMQANDTPASIAAAFVQVLPSASASGSSLTVAGGAPAVVVTSAAAYSRIVARERSGLVVDVLAPTPALRTTVAKAIYAALAASPRNTAADGSSFSLEVNGGAINDMPQRANIYSRTIRLVSIYSVLQTMQGNTLGTITIPATVGPGVLTQLGAYTQAP